MNLRSVLRRNRFKTRATSKTAERKLPKLARAAGLILEWRNYARGVAVCAFILGSLAALSWALDRPVHVISMDGSFQRVSPGQIEKPSRPSPTPGFMSADLDAIQRAVEALPWVDHARIQRRWPNGLHVTVVEQTAAARWGDSGLLNTRGELFVRSATHVPAELPRLSGPEGTESQVAQRYLSGAGAHARGRHAHRGAAAR